MGTTSPLERELDAVGLEAAELSTTASRLLGVLKRLEKASGSGDLQALRSGLDEQLRLCTSLAQGATELTGAWPYPPEAERELFASGALLCAVADALAGAGVEAVLEGGRLVCFPVVVATQAAKSRVTVDGKACGDVRPSVLAARVQERLDQVLATRPPEFLELLFTAWDYARCFGAQDRLLAVDVRVEDIYAVFTASPRGREYSKQDLGRDLYLLESSDVRVTRLGARVHFSRSTGTKGASVLTAVARDGRLVAYTSISFTEES